MIFNLEKKQFELNIRTFDLAVNGPKIKEASKLPNSKEELLLIATKKKNLINTIKKNKEDQKQISKKQNKA